MNTKSKSCVALILLIVIGIGGSLTFARSTDSNIFYLPIVNKPPVVRIDEADKYHGKYDWYVVGKVTNVSNKTVYDVNLTASLFLNDQLVEVITGTTGLPATFPSGSNLFKINPKGFYSYDEISISVDVESWSFEHDPEYLPLTVLSKNFSGGGELGHLTGEIRNDNAVPVTSIEIMVYPDTEFVTYATPDKTSLAPGEITAYTTWLYQPGFPESESFTVWAQGAVTVQTAARVKPPN
jgi:hypothetical protein